MATRTNEPIQGDGSIPPPPPGPGPGPPDHQASTRGGNKVFKSGPLFLSSKGIGWTSWKKRWFILTGTSLVFFRSDPSAVPQKGGEVNLTLGGIDLNNSGSVVVKADKKLLTVAFADGRDGRAFTLKAETMEDLYEWKTALETALAQAPSATLVMGQNGIFRNDQSTSADGSTEQLKDKQNVKSMVLGRPILLALEEIDGTPSFLEKALRFIEEYGIKVEGILRQAADVDDVEHRVREYEQGNIEFSPEEDPHVIADCIKYVLREMPSSPVPASCCNALLEACRADREHRVNAMRTAICETFPEPNRLLLQRILIMMQNVASHKAENRMSSSAVAACMAPLLLRPLLAGDCELENDFDVGGDGSMQLLQAAAAANHAQAIVITLLEEYENIFGEGSLSPELYSETEESGSESEEATDDDESYEDEEPEDGSEDSEIYTDDETENVSSGSTGRSYDDGGSTRTGRTDNDGSTSGSRHSSEAVDHFNENEMLLPVPHRTSQFQNVQSLKTDSPVSHQRCNSPKEQKNNESTEILTIPETSQVDNSSVHTANYSMTKSTTIASGQIPSARRPTVWGRTPAKKNLSMESIDISFDDEAEIQTLENVKMDFESRIADEAKENAVLRANLENQKRALYERRQALEQEVARLQEQLQKEKDLRRALETALKEPRGPIPCLANIDEETKADLEDLAKTEADISNLKQKVDDLGGQINRQHEENLASTHDSRNQPQQCGMCKDNETKSAYSPSPAERSKSSKVSNSDGRQTEKEKRMESTSSNKRQPSTKQQQQLDSVGSGKSRHNEQLANSAGADSGSGKLFPPMSSKKSSSRGEERRSQITNEHQSTDSEKARSPEKAMDLGNCNSEDKIRTENAPSNPDKSRNPDTGEDQNKGRASDQGPHCSQSTDKNLEPSISSRTNSRSS